MIVWSDVVVTVYDSVYLYAGLSAGLYLFDHGGTGAQEYEGSGQVIDRLVVLGHAGDVIATGFIHVVLSVAHVPEAYGNCV